MLSTVQASVVGANDFTRAASSVHAHWQPARFLQRADERRACGRVPEEGVSRLISFEKQTKQHTSVRRGLAIQLDLDTFSTPEAPVIS